MNKSCWDDVGNPSRAEVVSNIDSKRGSSFNKADTCAWRIVKWMHFQWGVGINQVWKCQSDIWPGHAQLQINLITRRKSSWDFIINSRANPTFPIVKYRSFLFLFLLPIHYNVNKGCGTTVNDMVWLLFPFTCVYISFLCTLWSYVRLAFPKFVVTDPPIEDEASGLNLFLSFLHDFCITNGKRTLFGFLY